MISEISTHGTYDKAEDADQRTKELNSLEGSDNLQYAVKIKDGKHVVILLCGFDDDSITA